MSSYFRFILLGLLGLGFPLRVNADPAPAVGDHTIRLERAAIILGDKASDLERLGAKEVQRYLSRISGIVLPVATENLWQQEPKRPVILVGTPQGNPRLAAVSDRAGIDTSVAALGDQGFVVKAVKVEDRPVVLITAAEPVGVLYGAYTFLEQMGIGFFLGGDALPGNDLPLKVPSSLDLRQKPVFSVRGTLPWYNFLNSPTTWDLDDFKYFFDQMSKMKNNFVGFHTYDSEPFAPYLDQGKLVYAAPLVTAQIYGWGAVRGLSTAEFGFGTGDYYDQEQFGSRAITQSKGPDDAIRRAQALLAAGLEYGKRRGVRVCVGFEVSGDPTTPASQAGLEARLRELVRAYPMLDYVWLWQSEGLGGGTDIPPLDSPLDILVQKNRKYFEYLKDTRRIAEAVRVSEYIQLGHALLKRIAPNVKLIVSGWGGDRWMRFSDFYEGFDKTLSADVIFAALDNIDPAAEPNVSAVYGKLSAKRQRWPIPWYESDGGGPRRDQFRPQTNTKEFTALCRDARAKGCQGLLAIHWRSRDVEEVAAYCAQYAWEPALGYEDFYRRFAARCFGQEHAEELGKLLRELEALGPRWTGGGGQVECGYFAWFEGNEMPREENLKTLARIRQRLAQVRTEVQSRGRLERLERLDHLIATIDWVMKYDAAALKLYPGGLVPRLIAEAETLKRQGNLAGSGRKAEEAWEALRCCGLREAMQIFPKKMSTQGEFGALATINVKAYASYSILEEKIRALLPSGREKPKVPATAEHAGQPLHLVMKTPPSLVPEKCPIEVRAVVIGSKPITQVRLGYRKPGQKNFQFAPMSVAFRKTYGGAIPAEAVSREGIEFFVEARDSAGGLVCAPRGFPITTYSASVVPWPKPAVYLTQCRALPRMGKNYRVLANVIDRPPSPKVELFYRTVGTEEYQRLPMANLFFDSFEAIIPESKIASGGIEYYVEVTGEGGRKWTSSSRGGADPKKDIPDTEPPDAVAGLKVELTGPYEVKLGWQEAKDNDAVVAYEVHRGGASDFSPTKDTLATVTFKTSFFDFRVRAGQTYCYAVRAKDTAGNLGSPQYISVNVPRYAPPAAPRNLRTTAGRGKIKVSWEALDLPVVGYNLYRTAGGGKPELLNRGGLVPQPVWLDVGMKEVKPFSYTVRAVDRGGQEGQPSAPVTASPLPRIEGPVLLLSFEKSSNAASGLKGTLVGQATYAPGVVGQALDLTGGGWVTFPHHDAFDLSGELTLEAWVKFKSLEGMPVFLSHGQWRERGFFVQAIGHGIRYSLGSLNDCDGGHLETDRWYYVVCTYDLKDMVVYLNGREVARRDTPQVDYTPWVGPFYAGRYTLEGKPYEVCGLIDEVKIYQRARTAEEIKKEYDRLTPRPATR